MYDACIPAYSHIRYICMDLCTSWCRGVSPPPPQDILFCSPLPPIELLMAVVVYSTTSQSESTMYYSKRHVLERCTTTCHPSPSNSQHEPTNYMNDVFTGCSTTTHTEPQITVKCHNTLGDKIVATQSVSTMHCHVVPSGPCNCYCACVKLRRVSLLG